MLGELSLKERIHEAICTAWQDASEQGINDLDDLADLATVEILEVLKETDPEDLGFEVDEED